MSEFEFDYQDDNFEDEPCMIESRAAIRRKNDWKHAKRNQQIAEDMSGQPDKPLHYYVKTAPEYYYQRSNKTNNKGKHRTAYGNYNPSKNWSLADLKKIDNFENQLEELFDEE